jgi:type II secretory pathway pseudopilin PulG
MVRRQVGFTLVETLIASVILFSVLASAFLSFQNSILASSRAERRIELLSEVPSLRAQIGRQLRSLEVNSGQGMRGDIPFRWSASITLEGDARDPTEMGVGGEDFALVRSFQLWEVTLELGSGNAAKRFQFTELTWSGLL